MWGGIALFSNGMLQFMGLQSQNDWETELNWWLVILSIFSYTFSFQFSSVTQSRPTLCDPMDCSMSGFPVYHQLPKLAQIHVHWVGDTIQKSHPMPSPSSPTFNLSQHQGFFQWVDSLHPSGGKNIGASASVLPMNIQGWFPLGLTGLIHPLFFPYNASFLSCTGSSRLKLQSQPEAARFPIPTIPCNQAGLTELLLVVSSTQEHRETVSGLLLV